MSEITDPFDIQKQYEMDVEGFFNYYAVPWDQTKFIKFPADKIVFAYKDKNISFASSFEEDQVNKVEQKRLGKFMETCYLGSARETDTHRLKFMLGERTELV